MNKKELVREMELLFHCARKGYYVSPEDVEKVIDGIVYLVIEKSKVATWGTTWDTAHGDDITVSEDYIRCYACKGSGTYSTMETIETCPVCSGLGLVRVV